MSAGSELVTVRAPTIPITHSHHPYMLYSQFNLELGSDYLLISDNSISEEAVDKLVVFIKEFTETHVV